MLFNSKCIPKPSILKNVLVLRYGFGQSEIPQGGCWEIPRCCDKVSYKRFFCQQAIADTVIMFKEGKEFLRRPTVDSNGKLFKFFFTEDNMKVAFDLNNLYNECKSNP